MLPNIEKSGEQDEERSEECLVNTGSNIEPDSSIKDKRGDNPTVIGQLPSMLLSAN